MAGSKKSAESTGNRPATSSDVARLANVSQSTVSRVFSDTCKLSDETRKRVLEAAKQLGYRPNKIARSLVSNRTNIIGIIVMNNESPFYATLTNLMITACRKFGFCCMVIRQTPGEQGIDTVTRALDYRVDGIVVTAIEDSKSASEICRQSSVPIVLLNRYIAGAGVDSVCCDNLEAGSLAAQYLLDNGHRTIACLMGDAAASTTRDRLAGLRSKAEERNISIDWVEYGSYSYESGREMCRKLLADGKRPDVIFCSGDIIAFGAMDVLRYELGLRVPEDISVMGFDDTAETAWASYNLTTMRQPYEELVETACQLLVRRIEGKSGGVVRSLHACRLVERGSVQSLQPKE